VKNEISIKAIYYICISNGVPEDISYSTSDSPTGPWVYKGIIMPEGEPKAAFTNHCGIIDFKGNSYFFYHNEALPEGGGFNRSTCIEQFTYNQDGTIPTMQMTAGVVTGTSNLNPFQRNEAETIDIVKTTGVHDLYFIFEGHGIGEPAFFDYRMFSK
jgi:hypothetical protein